MFTFYRRLPLYRQLQDYTKRDLRSDIGAGVTVGVLLVPQGMAYAVLAGLPPVYGLFSAIVPLLVYGLLGPSRQLSVGPVAIVSLLIATGAGKWASPGTPEYLSLVLQLTLMTGVVQLVAGVIRFGYLASFLSQPVIHGFSSAAALIIMGSQMESLLGIPLSGSGGLHQELLALVQHIGQMHFPTVAISAGALAIILVAPGIHRNIPGPLVALLLGTLIVFFMGLYHDGVEIVGDIPGGAPPFVIPAVTWKSIQMLWPTALSIGLIGFLVSYTVSRALSAKHPGQHVNANHEFVALGAANLAGAFFSAHPVAGGFARSAVNEQANAASGLASLISASVVMLCLLFLTPLFRYVPGAVLAAMIVVAVIPMITFGEMVKLWHTDRRDLFMLVGTFLVTLGFGVEKGVAISVVFSLILFVYRASNPHTAQLGRLPGTRHFMNIERFAEAETCDDILVFRFDGPLFFGNSLVFEQRMKDCRKEKGAPLKLVVLDAGAITGIDSSAMDVLEQLVDDFASQQIQFYTAFVRGPVRDVLHRSGLYEKIGSSHHFMNVADAVDWFTSHHRKEENQCLSNS